MVTSHFPAVTNSIALVSLDKGSVAKLATQPLTICSVFSLPYSAIIIATSDWLYTFLEVRRHSRPCHFELARSS